MAPLTASRGAFAAALLALADATCFPTATAEWLDLDEVKTCLKSLTVSPQTVYHTITHLQHGLGTLYSFKEIAEGATKSQASTGSCKLAVHDVSLDIEGLVAQLKRNMIAYFEVADFEGLLDSIPKGYDAFAFHEGIAKVFLKLNDAHTRYIPPHWADFPYWTYRTAYRGNIGFKLEPNAIPSEDPKVFMREIPDFGAPLAYKEVERLDDDLPWTWLKNQAQNVGFYKSWGARMNSYLNKWFYHTFDSMPFPDNSALRVNFVDGTSWELKVKVMTVPGQRYDQKTLQARTDTNIKWKSLRSWLDTDLHIQGTAKLEALNVIAQEYLRGITEQGPADAAQLRILPPGAPSAERPEFLDSRRLKTERYPETPISVGKWPNLELKLTSGKTLAPMFEGFWLPTSKIAILKIATFMPYAFLKGGDTLKELSLENMFHGLWDLHTSLVAKAGSSDKLLIDLSDNGGGMVELANVVIQMVSPRLNKATTLCSKYGARMDPFWQDWLNSFGGKLDEVVNYIRNKITNDEIDNIITRLQGLSSLQAVLEVPAPISWSKLDTLVLQLEASSELAARRSILANAVSNEGSLSGLLLPTLQGANSSDGWFPFTGDVKDTKTGKPFDEKLYPYRHPEVHSWGPDAANYTQKYLFACDLAFNFPCWDDAKHQWGSLAVVTNGLCGSACSLVATKLQFSAGATMFSYGGIPGLPMDTSAFAGGNVESWDTFSDQVLYAGVIGDIIHGPNTLIGQRLRDPQAKHRHYAGTLTLPLPTQARTTFNFNMMFMQEFGDDALPREWYITPAHKHFSVWAQTSADDRDTWKNLIPVINLISAEDWKEVRKMDGSVMYDCAAAPPTEPWAPECGSDRQRMAKAAAAIVAWFLGLLVVCCCCCCCGAAAWMVSKSNKGRQAEQARQLNVHQVAQGPGGAAAGVELGMRVQQA